MLKLTEIIRSVMENRAEGSIIPAAFGCYKTWLRTASGLLAAAAPNENGRALDYACGSGDLALRLCQTDAFAVVVGVESDEQLLETAKIRAIAGEGRGQNAPIFLPGDPCRLPFADTELDSVGCAFGMPQPEIREAALREIYRVMRPGAQLVLLECCRPENAPRKLLSKVQLAFDAVLLHGKGLAGRHELVNAREKLLSVAENETLLCSAGFENVRHHRFVFGDAVMIWCRKPLQGK